MCLILLYVIFPLIEIYLVFSSFIYLLPNLFGFPLCRLKHGLYTNPLNDKVAPSGVDVGTPAVVSARVCWSRACLHTQSRFWWEKEVENAEFIGPESLDHPAWSSRHIVSRQTSGLICDWTKEYLYDNHLNNCLNVFIDVMYYNFIKCL